MQISYCVTYYIDLLITKFPPYEAKILNTTFISFFVHLSNLLLPKTCILKFAIWVPC